MNLIETFQDLVARVPDLVQPLVVVLAGAIPFIEGEGAAAIGIVGGIHPVLAAAAGMLGNFLCVAVLVLASSGTRQAIVDHARARKAAPVGATTTGDTPVATPVTRRRSARAERFQRAFERYGVPGVSLLGPLLLPTQITATMLAAAGIGKARILVWQAVAIAGWTTAIAVIVAGAVSAAG